MAISLFASAARSDGVRDFQSSNTTAVRAAIPDNVFSSASAFSRPDGSFGASVISRNAGPGNNVSAQATFSSGYRLSNRFGTTALPLELRFGLSGVVVGKEGGPVPLNFASVSISFSGSVKSASSTLQLNGTSNTSKGKTETSGIFKDNPGLTSNTQSGVDFNLPLAFRTNSADQGQITMSLVIGAATLIGREPNLAAADFGNTIKLESITVTDKVSPRDLIDLSIDFETGYKMRVMPQVTGSKVTGTSGNDQISGTGLEDILDGKEGDDLITGLLQNDMIIGGSGNDVLQGGEGEDILYGDEGEDTLVGNLGVDYLSGGAGRDRLLFDTGSRFNRGAIGVDQVLDFEQNVDQIVLDKTTFNTLKRFSFATVRTIAQAQRSNAQITYVRQTGSLFYNSNGKKSGFGTGGQFADLADGLALTRKDFAVIA